jgi:hypothetical protein
MDRITKRKTMSYDYRYSVGDRVICWHFYPYKFQIATIVGETTKYWIVDDGRKYKKSDWNLSGYVGWADAFFEPVTMDSLRSICCYDLREAIMAELNNCDDYDALRSVYDIIVPKTCVPPYSVLLLDKYNKTGEFV